MGYSTNYDGVINFNHTITVPEIAKLETILGEDVRDHPDWGEQDFYFVDLCLTDDMIGLVWSNDEKTHSMKEQIEMIINIMTKEFPLFSLSGSMKAQGEEINDRYLIEVTNNVVTEIELD